MPELNGNKKINSRNYFESCNITNDLNISFTHNKSNSFKSNINSNINNYNFNYKQNLINTSSSFKNIFFYDEVDINNKINKKKNISTSTSKNYFINFNKNFKILSKPKRAFNSIRKMQTFNSDIVNNKNWGIISDREKEINNWKKMPNINIVKNILDKNIFRVRSNLNEIYMSKMNIENKLSFRKIEDEIKKYNNNYYKKIRLKKVNKTVIDNKY